MILNEDFKFRDDIKGDTVAIELVSGIYKGIVYRYTEVAILEEAETDECKIRFGYTFQDNAGFKEDILRKDKMFTEHIGLVLNSLILEEVTNTVRELDELDNLKVTEALPN